MRQEITQKKNTRHRAAPTVKKKDCVRPLHAGRIELLFQEYKIRAKQKIQMFSVSVYERAAKTFNRDTPRVG